MSEKNFKSTITIDLGAKKTGVLLGNHFVGDMPTFTSATLAMPDEGMGLTYSNVKRTATRHRVRGYKRYNLARRLLLQIVKEQLQRKGIQLNAARMRKETEALCGYLKRRGYMRIETEIDLSALEEVDATVFAAHPVLSLYFQEGISMAEQWETITNDLSKAKGFLNDKLPTDREFKAFLRENFPELKYQEKVYAEALKTLKDDAKALVNTIAMGHKHRTKYFEAIKADMAHDQRLMFAALAFDGIDRLWHLIANLSNLQLRAFRWYFNAPWMMTDDTIKPDRLQHTIVRAFKYFHPTKESRETHQELIKELESSSDIIDTLCTMDPTRTIPPYEDQNNRQPPVDQTLWLNPNTLSQRFGEKWKVWADRLQKADPALNDELDSILEYTDRKSRVKGMNEEVMDKQTYRLCYILQRALDRARKRDPYKLRVISTGVVTNTSQRCMEDLGKVIGTQHVVAFLQFASDYYAEVELAKKGLWIEQSEQLLERANLHPKMKNKVLTILVGNLFGGNAELGEKVIAHWKNKVTGRSSLESLCKNIELTRKDYGNEFNTFYKSAIYRDRKGSKPKADDAVMLAVAEKVKLASEYLQTVLGLTDVQTKHIANPYSLAQLYNLIETERSGFTKTSLAAHLENVWRMSDSDDQIDAVQASRLPADSVRPFDGALRMLLDRQAWEITKLAVAELKKQNVKNTIIDLSILIEENKFAFSASLAQLKKNRKAAEKAGKNLDRLTKSWQSKDERIVAASKNICPFTGAEIGSNGEIAHIIPRSYTVERLGTIFNAEVNLIYATHAGVIKKGDRLWSLSELHPAYLMMQFGTTDVAEIETLIESEVKRIFQEGRLGHFDYLSEDEQRYVRHALMLPDATQSKLAVYETLGTANKTMVNGTQAWFTKELVKKIRSATDQWCEENGNHIHFNAWQTNPAQGMAIRGELAKVDPMFEKTDAKESILSNVIDSYCAYIWSCGVNRICYATGGRAEWADVSKNATTLIKQFPMTTKIISIQSKNAVDQMPTGSCQIFKQGVVASNYLPIMVKSGQVYLGYALPSKDGNNPGNCVKVEGTGVEAFLNLVKDFVKPAMQSLNVDATYQFDKTRVAQHLRRVGKEACSEHELMQADILEAIHFLTARRDIVADLLVAPAMKNYKTRKEVLKDSEFAINPKLTCKKMKFKFSGTVTLPSYKEWEAVCNIPEIVEKLGKKFEGEDLTPLFAKLRLKKTSRQHKAVRHTFSLPKITRTPGIVRVFRKNFMGETLVQSLVPENALFAHFTLDKNGDVDWKRPIVAKNFTSANVAVNGVRYDPVEDSVPMTQWRQVQGIERFIAISPASKNRRMIRVAMTFDEFKGLAMVERKKENSKEKEIVPLPFESYRELPSQVKVFMFEHGESELADILGQPQSDVFIEELGPTLMLRYQVSSANKKMNDAFSKGKVIR